MKKVLVLGGRGFVGEAIVKHLKKCFDVYTFDRNPGGKNHHRGSINSLEDLTKACKGKFGVVNLVGLSPLKEPARGKYLEVQAVGVENVIEACKKCNVKKVVHISALGADKKSDVDYIRTKGLGQELMEKSGLDVTVFRPSIIFDKESELINKASKTAWLLFFPRIPVRMQPIYRQDVSRLVDLALNGKIKEKTLDIAGKEEMTMYEIVKAVHKKKGLPIIPVPFGIFKVMLKMVARLRLFGISKNQVRSLSLNNVPEKNLAEKYIELTSFNEWISKAEI
jgi:uncharacterized protein YbjT (DUF2867 family)